MIFGKLLFHIISGILGIYLSSLIFSNVIFTGTYKDLLMVGTTLGLINFFFKPILRIISLPIRILTLGLFTLIINMGLIWVVEIIFSKNLEIKGILYLFLTSLLISCFNFLFGLYNKR